VGFAAPTVARQRLPFAPPPTHPPRVHSRRPFRAPSASRRPASKSRSARVVSHHLDGFLRATARRFVAPCCRSWGSPRFGS
jgi:hypothetical protein